MKAGYCSSKTHPIKQSILCSVLQKTLLTVVLLVAGPSVATAADFQLDNGDSFNLGAGTLNLQCGNFNLQSGAAFNAAAGNIQLSGDWNNQGDFSRGTSTVVFNDDCGAASTSQITGSTHFYNLTAMTTAAHELRLESDQAQKIANALALTGAESGLLKIRSFVAGSTAYLILEEGGSQAISYVDVQDNHAITPGQWLARNTPAYFNSVDSGGNNRWFLPGMNPKAVPTLPALGLVMLLLLLPAVYFQQMDRLRRS